VDARISDATWAVLSGRLDEAQLIELCMVVGQYHLVAFTLNSLGVEGEGDLPEMPTLGAPS
jgi:alkylhydroperoxidase family enzyme